MKCENTKKKQSNRPIARYVSKANTDKFAKAGFFTIHPIHLDKVLTSHEYAFFEFLRNETQTGTQYVSYTLIHLELGLSSNKTKELKDNLQALGFVRELYCNKHNGSAYKIETDNVLELVNKLNACTNRVERLNIANKFRISKGLDSIVGNRIEKYSGSAFDIDNALSVHNKERYEDIPENKKEKGKKRKKKTANEPNTATPEANTQANVPIQKDPVNSIPEKVVNPFPAYLTASLYKLNHNEAEKRKGNDMYYNQSKEVYLNEFQKYSNNAFEPFFDGIYWKVKPNTNNVNLNKN
ncbi:hypothetical protein EZS27_001251 [termite gut metagenome]|uniref:Uncharacterized protein n=1 Tax=termite gut metagenome TaxID=433724 RepID=A0A5J4T0F1_9ZZZZ